MKHKKLISRNIFAIPVGSYFDVAAEECQLVYSPLANQFFLSTPEEVDKLENQIEDGEDISPFLSQLTNPSIYSDIRTEISVDTFCTLHLLLNEKCNFKCKYCYSASGRSTAELTMATITPMLDYFLSAGRKAVKDRTIMFMGGGEPALSWNILKEATLYAEKTAAMNGVKPHFAITTNGSILTEEMVNFFKEHNFTVQLSFEVLPDVQNEQRGAFDTVARNVLRLTESGVSNYVRSTITEKNVDRIPEMVEYCHRNFPLVDRLSCQQVVDPSYFTSLEVVRDFFDRYFKSFKAGEEKAKEYGITLRSSSSHLINYSKRERFCYNLVCLTPYGTLTVCPDVSSPNEPDYDAAVFGEVKDGNITMDFDRFNDLTKGSIHTIDKCWGCYAKWNCGSGCPSSRRVYSQDIFDSICEHYRRMLTDSLINMLALRHKEATGGNLFKDINSKLCRK